jgi:N-acetylglucosaminyldiphosphoundecaprenol N-acetyl-beta-D-mannosaminyltransferase
VHGICNLRASLGKCGRQGETCAVLDVENSSYFNESSVAQRPRGCKRVIVGGLPTAVLTREGLAQTMVRDCFAARASGPSWRPRLVFSSNGQGLALSKRDARFADAMAKADIIHADGMSVVFASRLLASDALPERVATTDFIFDACKAAEMSGLTFYFLGGREEDNARAVAWVRSRYPGLTMVGRHHGFFRDDGEEDVLADIRAARPDVLWLGLGKPRQELTALRWRDRLGGVGWIKTCGGMFDYYSGRSRRAPSWMQRCGLEWLFRSFQEPRLGKRYLMTNLTAAHLLLTQTHD